jgi:hypothetical protein
VETEVEAEQEEVRARVARGRAEAEVAVRVAAVRAAKEAVMEKEAGVLGKLRLCHRRR